MSSSATPTFLFRATAGAPGAVAILQLTGPDTLALLQKLTGRNDLAPQRLIYASLGHIDEGLVVFCPAGPQPWAQIFPHGGPLIVQQLMDELFRWGASPLADHASPLLYPEAENPLEAALLHTLAQAASPAAVDLLLAQPALWRQWLDHPRTEAERAQILQRSGQLQHLLTPPSIVIVGPPNVGKSTLANRMLGQMASLVADMPGTTRDWVAGLAQLQGVAVRWMDTPGLRAASDPIEAQAINLARQVVAQADVLLSVRDPQQDWLPDQTLPRRADVYVCNKIDTLPELSAGLTLPSHALAISAHTGQGLHQLEQAIVRKLGLAELQTELWAFTPELREMVKRGEMKELKAYL